MPMHRQCAGTGNRSLFRSDRHPANLRTGRTAFLRLLAREGAPRCAAGPWL